MTQQRVDATCEWAFSIDFGTTNTVAAVADAHGLRSLEIEGSKSMPSAVLLFGERTGAGRRWKVGHDAIRGAFRNLEWFDATPKRSVADQTLFLGGKSVPVVEAITAIYRHMAEQASRQHHHQPPSAFVITHPAAWATSRIQTLQAAARAAVSELPGWPDPIPLPEPNAAAQCGFFLGAIPTESRLVVLDLGGGTIDVSVVDRHADTLTPTGPALGLDALGGEDFDVRLARWMTAEVGAAGLYDRMATSRDIDERERAIRIRRQAQAIKEELTRRAVVPAQLPSCPPELPDGAHVQVNRPQFEDLIRGGHGGDPGLTEAVQLVDKALEQAGQGPPLAGAFLVGGCSRIPLLGAFVTESIRKPPLTHGDPTTAVAEGAAAFGWEQASLPPPSPSPTSQPPRTAPAGAHTQPNPPMTPRQPPQSARPVASTAGDARPPARGPSATPAMRGRRNGRWIVALGGILALVLLTGIAWASQSQPNLHTCADGTTVKSTNDCPTPTSAPPPEPEVTCKDGTVVRNRSQCPSLLPSSSSTTTSDMDEDDLIGMLDSDTYTDCFTTHSKMEDEGVAPAVRCKYVSFVPHGRAFIVHFENDTSEREWFKAQSEDISRDGWEMCRWRVYR